MPSKEKAQKEKKLLDKTYPISYRGDTPFSGRIVCADCGGFFGPKVWHSTDRYRTVIWQCNGKFHNERKCSTPHLREEDIKDAFVKAYNSLAPIRKAVLQDLETIIASIEGPEELQGEIDEATQQAGLIAAAARDLISRNASTAMPRDEFEREYARLDEKYRAAEARLRELEDRQRSAAGRRAKARAFANAYRKSSETIDEWDRGLWCLMVEIVRVYRDGSLEFQFRNGQAATVKP